SMTILRSPFRIRIDGRRRVSRGSVEWHTAQEQPMVGTPELVPEPSTVIFIGSRSAPAGSWVQSTIDLTRNSDSIRSADFLVPAQEAQTDQASTQQGDCSRLRRGRGCGSRKVQRIFRNIQRDRLPEYILAIQIREGITAGHRYAGLRRAGLRKGRRNQNIPAYRLLGGRIGEGIGQGVSHGAAIRSRCSEIPEDRDRDRER